MQKPYFTITQVISAIPISFFPDVDQNFKFLGHRNWFTHSIIIWEFVYIFNLHFIFLILILAIGLHCLCDVRFRSKKQVGFYTIKLLGIKSFGRYRYKNLNGKWSTVWLIINFCVAFVQFFIIIIFLG